MEEKAKETLFGELYQLDVEDSEEEDSSNASLILKKSKLSKSTTPAGAVASQQCSSRSDHPQGKVRTTFCNRPNPLENVSFSCITSPIPEKHNECKVSGGIVELNISRSTKSMARISGKRKREKSLEIKPEPLQIFKGLSFCM